MPLLCHLPVNRQYGREDVEYDSWYSDWMKVLARTKTRKQLESMLGTSARDAAAGAASHLRAIEATGSMTGCSQRRAQMGNATSAAGEKMIAVSGALEIHDLFPEHAHNDQSP